MAENTKISDDEILSAFKSEQAAVSEPVYSKEEAKGISDEALLSAFRGNAPEMQTAGGTLSGGGGMFQPEMIGGTAPAEQSALVVSGPLGSGKFSNIPVGPKGKFDEYAGIVDPDTRKGIAETVFKNITDPKDLKELQEKVPWYDMSGNPTQVKSLFLHEWSEKTDPFELVGSAAQAGVGMLQSLPPLVAGAGRLAKDIVGGLTYDWDGDPSGLTQAKVLTEQQRKGLSEQQIRDAELSAPDKLIRASRVAGDAILEAEEQLRTAVANFAENKSMLWDKAKVGFASAPDYGDFSGLTATLETEQQTQARRAAKTAELMEEAEKNFAARLNAKHVEYLHREKNPAVLARDIEAVWKYPAVKTFATNVMELMMPPAEDAAPGFGGDMQAAKANRRAQAAEAAEVGVQAAIAESNRLQEDPEQVGAIAMTTPLNVVGAGAMLFGGLNRASQALARGLKAIGKTDQEINAMFSAELAAARAQAEAAAMAREQPGRIERALGSTADTFDKAKAAFAQVPVPAQYIGMAGLGGLAGAVTADDPLTGFLEGAGTGAAGRLGMKIGGGALLAAPRLGQELIKAGRLAGAEMGRFEALERLGSASPEVAKFVNWSQKVGGGNVMDFIEKNASVFVQHNVSMLPMMVALGVLEDKDAKEFAEMWAEFATYGFIHGQVLGGILGNDPVRMRMDREANMRQAQRVVNSLSPESRENVRNLTWDRVVEQSEARVEQARAAAEAQLATDPNSPEAAEAQADYNFANQLHRQNLIAPPEARAAFEDGIRLSLAQASNLINGVLTPNSNMNIELLTTQQIYDKMIAANPNYNGVGAPLTIEQAMAMNPGADGAKIGKGISDSGFTMDAAKDTVFVNLDNALAKGRLSGEAIPNVIAHEVVGHGLFAKSEYRQKIAPLYNKMFGTEVMDENGNWQQITPAEPGLSREDLLEKFFNKYLEGKTPESVAQYAEAAGVWDKANNTFDNNKVVELMREEVLAEAHAGRFYGNPESPLQRGIGWLASRISGGNLKTALNHLYSVAGPAVYAQWTSGVTGATYSPEVMRAIRNVEREMKKYDGDFTDAEPGEAVAAPITRKDVIKSPEMLNKYFKDTGKFETTPVAVVTDAEGNVVQSVKLTDNEAFEGSWNYQQNEATGDNVPNRESGFGDIPAEVAGIQVPVGGRVQVKRQIAYDEATGKPIERKNKATVEYLKRRVQMLRDAIDNAGDPSQLGRFRAIKGGQGKDDEDLHYTGKMTPEQRSAIAALPESVVPSSIKELLLKYDDLMTRGDGTVLDIDYASRLNDKGNYQAFSPKIRQIVPLQLHLSMAGNFYTTAWDISDLRRKVRLYEKYAKGVFEPWGGDTQKFWNEFRTILLPNLTNPDPNVPGWQGLDADPNVAKLKRTIYEKMLGAPNPNVPGVEAIPELSREKFSRSEKKLDKQSSFDQIIKSFRLDSVTAAEENANSDFKYPIPYKARFLPEQEAGGTGAQMRFQPEGKEDPTNVAPGFYSKAGRLLLGKMGGRASAEQLKGMLDPQKGSGVKPDELKRSGIIQFIDATQAEKGFITKEDVNKFLTENYAAKFETKTMRPSRSMSEDFEFYSDNEEWGSVSAKFKTIEEAVNAAQEMFGMDRREAEVFVWDTNEADSAYTPNETEYSSYTLPGGKNYKEVVLQVPGTKFVSSHFSDVPDYVAHLRTAEHGNGLLIEEIQSDLHQKAREIGYSEPVPLEETLRALNESLAAAKEERSNIFEVRKLASSALRDITKPTQELSFVEQGVVKWANEKIANYPKEIDRINAGIEATEKEIEDYTFGRKVKTSGGVPDAPFRKDWPLQLFKYALKDAVATGKEWIGWTAGEQQAERYDLSEQVDSVNYDPLNKRLIAVKDGQRISDQSNIPKEKLADYIGKDLANKLLQPDTLNGAGNHVLSGIDLKVGGEGMKGFYDTMLPKEIGKYVKQWGGKVEPSVLEGAYKDYSIKGNPHIAETMSFSSKENAEAMLASRGRGKGGEIVGNGEVPKIWKIAITPEMQESVAGGQARFMPAKLDAEYTAAFEAKDEQKARALVDEAAKQAGYTVRAGHATPFKFNEFDRSKISDSDPDTNIRGFFFSTDPSTSAAYVSGFADRGERGKTKILNSYLKLGRTIGRKEAQNIVKEQFRNDPDVIAGQWPKDESVYFPRNADSVEFTAGWKLTDEKIKQFEETGELREGNKLLKPDPKYGGVDMYERYGGADSNWELVTGYEDLQDAYDQHSESVYIIRDSNQAKLADPFTYDNAGKLIPLSERFNAGTGDIRFMPQRSDTEYAAAFKAKDEEKARNIVNNAASKFLLTLNKIDIDRYQYSSDANRLEEVAERNERNGKYPELVEQGRKKASELRQKLNLVENQLNDAINRLPQAYANLKEGKAFVAGLMDIAEGGGIDFEELFIPAQEHKGAIVRVGDADWLLVKSGDIERGPSLMSGGLNRTTARTPEGILDQAGRYEISKTSTPDLSVSNENPDAIVGIALNRKTGDEIFKSSPFTYDNEGRLIPLSERFNVGTGDIRFMPPKEEEPEKARQRSSLRVRMTREALTDAALSQASWKDWYSEHQETLDDFFGDMAPLFQNILAITSQAASVKANVGLALKAFGQLMRGEEFTGYLPAVAGNLGKLRDAAGPSGQKIQAYKAANEGDASSVVVDRHIARLLFGVDTPTPKQFAKAAKVLTQIAEKIGWTPAQVQAALWAHSIVQSGKQPESYGNYLKRLESQGGITKRIGSLGEGSAGADVVGGPRGRYSPNDEGSLSRVAPVGEQGAEARFMPNVAVVPERFTGTGEEEQRRGRYVEPPKFFKRFNISQYEPGGKFFDAETGEDLTNKSYENASIAVVDGKPTLVANNESDSPGTGPLFRTNLFKQKAGWKWVSEGAPDTSTIVSVEGQGKHLYALQADFQNGVMMARYPDKASEPRLRPTGRGELAMGEQIGTIDIRGKQHPVYDKVTIGQAPESAQIRFMPEQPAVDEQTQQTRINEPGRTAADIGVRPDEARNRGGQRTARGYSPLSGAPNVFGRSGPIERISDVADRYAESRGIAVRKQAAYVGADVERGRRIAEEYANMPHDPQNPRVQEAYADLIRQSGDQYKALVEDGYKAWFIDPANDPYEGKPWRAMRDLRENESMGVFPTEAGFGSGDTELNVADNPLLGDSGLKWPYGSPDGPLKRVLWNDVFRYIHDAFGHGIEGAGFRADGEENAWQAHVRLFDGPAVGAMTSETRGQNSWLNFGPHADKNKTASVEETVFADQKTGLMPEWTWNEGVAPDEPLLKNTESSKSPSAPELTETGLVIAKTDKAGQPEPFKLTQDVLTRFMPAQGVNIEDYADRTVICLPADRMGIGQMFVGPTGKKKELSVEGQGGRGFMNIFRNGGWAFSERGAASSLLKRLKTVAGDEDSAIVAVTAMSPINHLKNQTGQLGYVEALRAAIDAKTISKKQANAHIKSISDAIIRSSAKSIKDATREKFKDITSLDELEKAVKAKSLNFGDAEPLLQQMQRKTHPISFKEASEMGISFQDVARDLADPEIVDLPFGSVVSLLEIPWKQQPEKTDFHYSYPWTIEGKVIGHLKSFPMIGDLSSDPRIRNKAGLISAQPLQTVLPILDKIK